MDVALWKRLGVHDGNERWVLMDSTNEEDM
jgi:hypothetical protein